MISSKECKYWIFLSMFIIIMLSYPKLHVRLISFKKSVLMDFYSMRSWGEIEYSEMSEIFGRIRDTQINLFNSLQWQFAIFLFKNVSIFGAIQPKIMMDDRHKESWLVHFKICLHLLLEHYCQIMSVINHYKYYPKIFATWKSAKNEERILFLVFKVFLSL